MELPVLRDLVPIPRVWERMEQVEQRLMQVTTANNAFLTEISQHLIAAGGKRYRPLLAQVAAELGPATDDGPVEAGVAVELVHAGSLYHDDVIDNADTRHGVASVNKKWNDTAAILGGDFLLARASEVAAPLGTEAVALIAHTYAVLCEGQVLELQLEDDLEHRADGYFDVIGGKTASLIRTSARLGALTSGASRDIIEAVSTWAWEMGLVFQITDDVLDLIASDEFLGKPAGSDIGEGTYTLPVLHALDGPNGEEIHALLASGRPYPQASIDRVIELVRGGGYIEQTLDNVVDRIKVAEAAVAPHASGDMQQVFANLDQYLLARVEAARLS